VSARGSGATPNEWLDVTWSIVGVSGCDAGVVVASGTAYVQADANGDICVNHVYYVEFTDCGEYKLTLNGKTDNYRVTVMGEYRLDLDKTGPASVCSSAVDQTANYTYTVTNNGDLTLYNVTITDNLAGTVPTGDTDLTANAAATFYDSYTIPGGTPPGPVTNYATATSNTENNNSGEPITSGQATWTVNVLNCCAIQVTVTPDSAELNCNNNHAVLLTATPTGAAGTVTYQWYRNGVMLSGETSATYTTIAAGEYHVVATDTAFIGCSAQSNHVFVTYVADPVVTISADATELNCNNADALLTASIADGEGPFHYQWYKVGTGAVGTDAGTYTAVVAGEYYVVVTDGNQCTDESNHITITYVPPPVVTLSADATELNCNNADALLTASVTPGEAPYAYTWYRNGVAMPGETGSTYLSVLGGTYYVHVTDNNSCADDSNEIVISSVPAPVVTISADDAELNCNNADTLLTATVTPGEAPYGYQWYKGGAAIGGATNATYVVTAAGTYYVHVIDNNGCADDSNQIVVTYVPSPVVTIAADDAELNCNNADALLTATVTPGEAPYAYQWYKNDVAIGGATNATYVATTAGTYYVHVTDNNGCTDDSNAVVISYVPPPVVTLSADATELNCNNADALLTATVAPGEAPYGYQWYKDGIAIGGATNATYLATAAGTYYVHVIDNNRCADDSNQIVVTSVPGPVVTIAADDAELNCNNADALLTASVTPGEAPYAYQWYKDGVAIGGATNATYAATAAGTYYVRVTDNNQCMDDSNVVTVVYVPDPVVAISKQYDHCLGTVAFTATASNGETPYTFAWDVDGDGFDDGTGVTKEITGYGLSGTVRVQVTDHNGCTDVDDEPYAINARLTVQATLDSLQQCTGYACLSAAASGGAGAYTYAWDLDNDGQFDDGTGATACHLFADGTLTVRVRATDGLGCQATDDLQIVVAVPTPQVDITKTVNKDIVYPDTTVIYRYYITNTGTCPLLNLTLSDDKIAGVAAAILSGLTDQDGDGQTDDLAAGASASATKNQAMTASTHNCATVTGQNSRGATANAQDCADVTVIHPCISLVKDGPAMAHESDVVTFRFVVKNCSDDAVLYGVTVYDPMFGTWGPKDMQPGEEIAFTRDYTIPHPAGDPVCNSALAKGKDVLGGEWTEDDSHCIDILHPCIDIAKTGVYQAHEGDTITYQFRLANCSADTALQNVQVTDPLLGGLIWGPGNLAAGQVVNFSTAYVVPALAPDPVENTVTATGQDALGKSVSDQARHYVDILHPCIDLEKSGPAEAYEGELIDYEFTLTNCSADTDLPKVTVTDPLLGGVIWGPGYLEAKQSLKFVVRYQVPWDQPNPYTNTATAEGWDSLDGKVTDSDSVYTRVLVPLGFKFWDKDRDGTRQQTEPLIGGWQIQLQNVHTGERYNAWTNSSIFGGHYGEWFPPKALPEGLYDVYEVVKAAWAQTYPATNSGVYRIYYHPDGTFELLSPRPQPYYGLSFGNRSPECCFDWIVFHSNRDGNWELYGSSGFGGDALRLTSDPAVDLAPAVSGAELEADVRIAFQSNRTGNWDIYRMDADGENLVRLTTGTALNPAFNNTDPVWAPTCDAQKLAFVSDRDGNQEIYVMNGDGSGQQRLTNSPTADTDPDWALAGEAVVFQSMRNGNWDIYRIDVAGTNLVQLTDNAADDVDPVWSPDGERIAFRSNREGKWHIYVMPATGGAAVRLSAGGDNLQAVWALDSEQLAYQSDRDGNWEIYVVDVAARTETRVTNDAAKSQAPTWSCTSDSVVYQTDADGDWELHHVLTENGMLLAHVTNNPATDLYPAWAPREEDGSLAGLDMPLPTPMPSATPLPTATPIGTPQPTGTPFPTETPIPTYTPIPTATATPVPTEPGTRRWIYLPLVLDIGLQN